MNMKNQNCFNKVKVLTFQTQNILLVDYYYLNITVL